MQIFRRSLTSQRKYFGICFFPHRQCSDSIVPVGELVKKQNYLFSEEQKRRLGEVGRFEKITVEVSGPPQDIVLVMNKEISTPYDCCKHISLPLCQRSPLALLNEQILWDMHRPLPGNCRLRFLSFKDKDVYSLNKAFWRTGSFILGAVIKRAFKENVEVLLHSFPEPKVSTGSFIYDAELKLENVWNPTEDELKILSGEYLLFVQQNHKIEWCSVKKSVAMEIFEGNPYKLRQVAKAAAEAKDYLIPLYRVSDHIDIDSGPMISNTSFFGRCCVASVHHILNLETVLHRFQGVALPSGILLNSFAFSVLQRRAKLLNPADTPDLPEDVQKTTDQSLSSLVKRGRIYPDPLVIDS